METNNEQLIQKLMAVLRRMAKTAQMNQWMGRNDEADPQSIDQFNRILDRLRQVDTTGAHEIFAPLPPQTSWISLGGACRNVIACYESEPRTAYGNGCWDGFWTDAKTGFWIDKMAFRHGMPPEINEFGEFIKEKISEWQNRARAKRQ